VVVASGIKCWGANFAGQLGDGTNVNRNLPTSVVGLSGVVTALAMGSEHTCAVVAGTVKCWGANFSGQLGDGTHVNRVQPVGVSGLPGAVSEIAAGSEHTCAVTTSGAVWCWGANFSGQLGTGGNVNSNVPVKVSGLPTRVMAIAAGSEHTCSAMSGGTVACWGANWGGQLGDGANANRSAPVVVDGLPRTVVGVVAGSEHSCALTSAGTVWCWGANFSGQLGDGTNGNRNLPVRVSGLPAGVVAVAAGSEHTCAATSRGAMTCWGANFSGQLGDGSNTNRNRPVDVARLSGTAVAITLGSEHSCAITAGAAMGCWGANFAGQLGDGSNANRSSPVVVSGVRPVRPYVRSRIL
jgi:alpha-tubulin suppressor-like RCC1 family protein